jgi:hypothetical protein
LSLRKYKTKDIVEKIAIEKYQKNGLGITIEDIETNFYVNKVKAQRTLKHFHQRKVLFTANDLILEGITVLQNKSPQQYFATCIKAKIVEDLVKRNNVLVDPTGVDLLAPPSSTKSASATSEDYDDIVNQTLEGYVLPLLPQAPIFLHNFHFKIGIDPECYLDLNLPYYDKNNGKHHSENIRTSHVDYVLYPNGTVDIHARCSNNPLKLETEIDRSMIIAFFGQIRDRLIILLRDERERIVPEITEWHITECDINRDIKLSHLLHFSAIKIQVKYLDHLFRIYIKSMGKETVCRVEESLHPKESALETINDIFNPMEKVEKQIAALNAKISAIFDIVSKTRTTIGSDGNSIRYE